MLLCSESVRVRVPRAGVARAHPPFALTSTGWTGPGLLASGGVDLSYWDLHGFLLLPTAWLLTAGKPSLLDERSDGLTRVASYTFVGFILTIAVAQAFVWDSVGAQIGACSNPPPPPVRTGWPRPTPPK